MTLTSTTHKESVKQAVEHMDYKEFERVTQLHKGDTQAISHQVRKKIFTVAPRTDASTSANVSVIPYTCRGDSVGGPLKLPNSIFSPNSTLAEEDLAYVVEVMLHRASCGSVALTVLEDCFSDSRRGNRSVCVRAYAEYIDIHRTGVFDRNGCQWPLNSVTDRFDLACKGWRYVASVTGERMNTSVRIAKALRGVVGTTYGCVCTGKLSSSGGMLAVALENTIIAAAGALAVVTACPRGMGFIQGGASMRLPCGSILTFEAHYDNHAKRVNDVFVRIDDHGRMSHAVRVSVKVLDMVLMGVGVHLAADGAEDDNNKALEEELASILKMQSAVLFHVLRAQHDASSEEDILVVQNLVRCLTIYRVFRAEALRGNERNYGVTEDDRVRIAREEALDIMRSEDWDFVKWDIGEYLGEDTRWSESESCAASSSSSGRGSWDNLGEEQIYTHGVYHGVPRPPAPTKAKASSSRVRYSTSGVPLLSSDITTRSGISIRAQQGVVLQPDPRGYVVIKKRSFLWGRVIFENGGFATRALVDGPSVLRAVIPVQSLTIGFVGFEQFDASHVEGRGSDVANLLLSGTFGADAALWALKKIIYSGYGLKPGFGPSYLAGMKGQVEADGYGINSALGSEAVKAIEVLVKDDRVFLDAKGDLETLEVKKVGRKFKCVPVSDDLADACAGTIETCACIF